LSGRTVWPATAGHVASLLFDLLAFGAIYVLAWLVIPGGRRCLGRLLDHARHLLGKSTGQTKLVTTC
jgi:hypothetical protein